MTDKDKMIGEMAKELHKCDCGCHMSWLEIDDDVVSQYMGRATHLFNAGIRPARGFQCRGCTEYADGGEIEPNQYEGE